MKHTIKSIACVLVALALTLTFVGCVAEKNTVTDGFKKFDKISSEYKIPEKDIKISESSDSKTLNYTYSFDVEAGSSKVTLMAAADKELKEFTESSVFFFDTGKASAGKISQTAIDDFAEIAKNSILSFTELSEEDADSIIKELKVNLAEAYNGKTSLTKTVGNYLFGFSSSAILTAFTIKNNQADINSSQENITVKPAQ